MINYGGFLFTAPVPLSLWLRRADGGVYVVQVIDSGWRPHPFRPIYFGKAIDLADRIGRGHEVYPRWVREAGGPYRLFVSTFSSDLEFVRAGIESILIDRYQPACNRAGVSLEALFFRHPLGLGSAAPFGLAALANRRALPEPPSASLKALSLFRESKRPSLGELLGDLRYAK